MSIIEAILLGAVQGLTEFFPISSSGHLVFFQHLFGFTEPPIFFDCMVHGGTLVAILVYLCKDILRLAKDFALFLASLFTGRKIVEAFEKYPGAWIILLVIIATVPTCVMGYFFRDYFVFLFGSLRIVGVLWLLNGLILWITRGIAQGEKVFTRIKVLDAILIGIAQGCAIMPGLSRSGLTISTALFRGFDRQWAVKFSLLLSIPAIAGAIVLEACNISTSPGSVAPIVAGTLTAAVIGYLTIRFLMRLTREGKLFRFAFYSIGIGIVAIAVSFLM